MRTDLGWALVKNWASVPPASYGKGTMTASPVHLRNLESIHETSGGGSARWATFFLGAAGLAAVFASGWLLHDRKEEGQEQTTDPLAELLSAQKKQAKQERAPEELSPNDLDFPELLSDADERTTALVAVEDEKGRLVEQKARQKTEQEQAPSEKQEEISPEELPSQPLAAGSLLNATSVTKAPKDELTQVAAKSAEVPEDAPAAPPGNAGGFQVQVASFKDQADADRFVAELRQRGHKAFRQPANVPDRGLWHRVRIGPFKTKYRATLYKSKFEKDERMAALVIDPDKVERKQKIRAAKLAERIRKYGTP